MAHPGWPFKRRIGEASEFRAFVDTLFEYGKALAISVFKAHSFMEKRRWSAPQTLRYLIAANPSALLLYYLTETLGEGFACRCSYPSGDTSIFKGSASAGKVQTSDRKYGAAGILNS